MNNRPYKGKSIIAFPANYVIVDIETTGLSPEWNNIIEIGAIRYKDGVEVNRFSSLVQPPAYDDGGFVDSFITQLTGITNEMLAKAPKTKKVIKDFACYLESDDILIGYNTNFDINFLYDNFVRHTASPLTNNFIDLMRFSRKLYPDMPHHRLRDMVVKLGIIRNGREHRAVSDVEVTQECYTFMVKEALRQFTTEESFCKTFSSYRNYSYRKVHDIKGDPTKADPDNPLYGQYCVFTGKLERFIRTEAMQIVADLGGFNENNVTKKTNFLILGNNDYCKSIKDGKSNKHKRAEKLKLDGQDIEIISENVFYDMINYQEGAV